MKKNKLDLGYEFDFELAGIVCPQKEYKLAWYLNGALDITLLKQPDIRIEFSNQPSILISNFKYQTDLQELSLLQNKLVVGNKLQYLLPELKQFDFFVKLKDETGELTIENVCTQIREIPLIEYVSKLNFDQLKSKENLLY